MKNKDLKKGKESTIGKIIYGFLLFMPLLAILSTCLYAIFNKNAYQSYDKQEGVKFQKLTSNTGLIVNETYTINQINDKGNIVIDDLNNVSEVYNNFYEIMETISANIDKLSELAGENN